MFVCLFVFLFACLVVGLFVCLMLFVLYCLFVCLFVVFSSFFFFLLIVHKLKYISIIHLSVILPVLKQDGKLISADLTDQNICPVIIIFI